MKDLICLDFQRWTRRGQELKDKLNRRREESSEDIDVNPIPTVAGSTARLVGERNIARYSKPSRYDDRVELLSDVDDQYSAPSRYSPTRSDRSVPKNVFDDIWFILSIVNNTKLFKHILIHDYFQYISNKLTYLIC